MIIQSCAALRPAVRSRRRHHRAAITFFGDRALESFLAVYLRTTLGSTVLLTGAGISCYHLAP